jgi:LIVCS family branched-chain amino acid:cation transporter
MNTQPQSSIVKTAVIAGFAIFLMFFGGGNLVFPILAGIKSGDNYLWSIAGIFISAVILPLIGLICIMRAEGSHHNFFKGLGNRTSLYLVFTILTILCPLGCIPRNIMVSFGGVQLLFPDLNFPLFSSVYSLLAILFIFKWKSLVETLGKYLTPVFIFGVFMMIGVVFFKKPTINPDDVLDTMAAHESFWLGLTKGYLTMDLISSFFFGGAAYLFLKEKINTKDNPKALYSAAILASFVAAAILLAIYAGFGAMGVRYSMELQNVDPASYLPAIITLSMGSHALAIATFIIVMACFTTLVALVAIYAQFLVKDFLPHFSINNVSYKQGVWITTGISFTISLLGFKTLNDTIGMALEVLYPALVAYAILKLLVREPHAPRRSKITFWSAIVLVLAGKLYSF